jgi:hypothetical protein
MNERPADTFQRKAISRLAEFVSESRFVDAPEGGR